MRIGVISDLHIDRYNTEEIKPKDFSLTLANEVARQSIELLIIAGDIANDHHKAHRFIQEVEQLTNIRVLFVPGNHDFWNSSKDAKTTWDIYRFFKMQQESLIGNPYIINDKWAIVGSPAWYDYSFASDRFSYDDLKKREFSGGTWQDKVRINWQKSDQEVSKYFRDEARRDLEKVKDKNIILVTHVPTHKAFRVPMPHRIFDYYNAFIGTSDFNDFYDDYTIRYSVMGHIHFRHEIVENGVDYICACLGYRREWRTNDLQQEIRDTLKVIEIGDE